MEKQAQLPFSFVGGDKRGGGSGVPTWDVGLGHGPQAGLSGQTLLARGGVRRAKKEGPGLLQQEPLLHPDLHGPLLCPAARSPRATGVGLGEGEALPCPAPGGDGTQAAPFPGFPGGHTDTAVERNTPGMFRKKEWSRLVMSDSLQPHGLQPARLLHPWDFPGKSTGVGCHFLLQGIFPTQGLNPGLPHCRQTLYCLNHQGSCKVFRGCGQMEHFSGNCTYGRLELWAPS